MVALAEKAEPCPETTSEVMIGRTLVARFAIEAVGKAMELAGGRGFFRGSALERLWRDVQAARYHPLQEKAQAIVGHEIPMADAVLPHFKKKSLGGIYFAYRSKGEAIEGKLLRLRLNDLLKLDKYEGVDFGMYERTCVEVVVGDEKTKAYVYIAGKKMRG
jgi:gamma-glutamylcyclotransferase (GGCT)/AIG2-like uncharacterized protein YtfP